MAKVRDDKLSDKHKELLFKAALRLREYASLMDGFKPLKQAIESTGAEELIAYRGMVKELIERIDYELEKTSKD